MYVIQNTNTGMYLAAGGEWKAQSIEQAKLYKTLASAKGRQTELINYHTGNVQHWAAQVERGENSAADVMKFWEKIARENPDRHEYYIARGRQNVNFWESQPYELEQIQTARIREVEITYRIKED